MTADHLGHVQRAILGRLAASPEALTTADLLDLCRQSVLSAALRGLRDRDLATVTGTIPPDGGRGAPRMLWEATEAGRRVAELTGGGR